MTEEKRSNRRHIASCFTTWSMGTVLSVLFPNYVVASAGIPEAGLVLYGSVTVEGQPARVGEDVAVIARVDGVPNPVGSYHMGDNPGATGVCAGGADCYELRIKVESLEPGGTQSDDAALIGQTVKIYIQQDGGPEEYVAEVVANRAAIMELNLNLCHHTQPDYDCDGDVDLTDFTTFADCNAGPDQPPAPTLPGVATADCLSAFDDDSDGDVDMLDLQPLQAAFTGP